MTKKTESPVSLDKFRRKKKFGEKKRELNEKFERLLQSGEALLREIHAATLDSLESEIVDGEPARDELDDIVDEMVSVRVEKGIVGRVEMPRFEIVVRKKKPKKTKKHKKNTVKKTK